MVDAAAHMGNTVGRVKALIGIHLAGVVSIRRDLPSTDVNGLNTGLHLLHGLVAGHRAQRVDIGLGLQQLPQALGAHASQRVLDVDRSTETQHIFGRVSSLNALPTPIIGPVVVQAILSLSILFQALGFTEDRLRLVVMALAGALFFSVSRHGFTPAVGLGGDLYRIEFSIHDHGLAEFARPAEAIRFFGSGVRGKLAKQAVEFLVEEACDEFRRVFEALALIVHDAGKIAVQHALRNHQTVDAVGGEVFHVAIEQACTFTAEYSVAITDDSPYGRACSVYRALANAFGGGPQIWIAPRILGSGEKLVRVRELGDRDGILIGMPGPSSIQHTV